MYLCGCSLFLDGGAGCNFLACLHTCSSQHRPSVLLRSSIDGPQVTHHHEHWFIQTQIVSISQCTAESCEKRSPSRDPQVPASHQELICRYCLQALSIHIYTSCIYFAHWELFPCLYYPASLLQVCHFSCSCISSSASLTSQEVLHQYQTTAWLEYLCDSIMCHAEQQQQGNEQYYKLEQSKNGQNKK